MVKTRYFFIGMIIGIFCSLVYTKYKYLYDNTRTNEFNPDSMAIKPNMDKPLVPVVIDTIGILKVTE